MGFSVHTGWAAMVAVARRGGALVVVDRRRVEMLPVPEAPRYEPPFVFHAAQELSLDAAEHLVHATEQRARSGALEAIGAALEGIRTAGHEVVGASVITGKTAPTTSLAAILRSHAAIHAAEGELYRSVIRCASEDLGLPVLQVPAPELVPRAASALELGRGEVPGFVTDLGRALGPPWTADHKAAALAAILVLG
ncbi:MAG TPA: hypothetical protein VLQ79_08595 [Myxococcaceae bacterium]|nr:hypothetical protein [Myxococcaceae bacterium]